ncbi:MAG: nuclear transport factor 2 family protein [Acidimicrobiales bacterium]|nr:nuclear transport factor 2 family protein [Acidimicrobiales bacterium]
MAATPEELVDIEAIRQLKARYFRLMDQKQWDAWRDVFVEDVEILTPDDTGDPTPIVGRDAFVDGLVPMIDAVPTVHHGHMSEIAVDGDSATGVWAMEDNLWWPPESGLGHMWGTGWYEETYRRCPDGAWRIATMHLRRIRIEADGSQIFPKVVA